MSGESERDVAISSAMAEGMGGAVIEAVTGVPAPLQDSLKYVLKRFTVSLMTYPTAFIEGKVNEMRATSDAKIAITRAVGDAIAKKYDVPLPYVEAAGQKAAERIVGRQLNLDSVSNHAIQELAKNDVRSDATVAAPEDDWLNVFETEALNMSSERMRIHFGRLLAGEIKQPGSFSVRTVKSLGQMDAKTADLFVRLCSMATALRTATHQLVDLRVLSIGTSASLNGLMQYGLSFNALNELEEAGLIISDYNSSVNFEYVTSKGEKPNLKMHYLGRQCELTKVEANFILPVPWQIHGVKFTKVGRELFSIVDPIEDVQYSKALSLFFRQHGFDFTYLKQ